MNRIEEDDPQELSPEWYAADRAVNDSHHAHDDALYAHDDALLNFLTTVPITMAGLLAALDHAGSNMYPDEESGGYDDHTVLFDAWGTKSEDIALASAQYPAVICRHAAQAASCMKRSPQPSTITSQIHHED